MDLRMFYQKMRKLEQEITAPHVVIVSEETPDGGKSGVKTEVSREMAAKLIVEGRARLADSGESSEFYQSLQAGIKERDREQLKNRLSVNFVSEEELQVLRKARKQ